MSYRIISYTCTLTRQQLQLHIFPDGTKFWYLNGQRHREDGPAIEYANGHKSWYRNGQRHREDGPAIERANGDKEYWIKGQRVLSQQEQEYQQRLQFAMKLL